MDITRPPTPPQSKTPTSVTPEQPSDALTLKNPYHVPCTCGKSMVVVAMPFIHCVACHDTYRARQLTPPVRCAHCGYNLMQWRARNGFTFQIPVFA